MPNAPHKNPQYSLRISSEIMNKLKYIADCSGRSANKEIEQLIIQHIEAWENEHGPIYDIASYLVKLLSKVGDDINVHHKK